MAKEPIKDRVGQLPGFTGYTWPGFQARDIALREILRAWGERHAGEGYCKLINYVVDRLARGGHRPLDVGERQDITNDCNHIHPNDKRTWPPAW